MGLVLSGPGWHGPSCSMHWLNRVHPTLSMLFLSVIDTMNFSLKTGKKMFNQSGRGEIFIYRYTINL